MNRHTARILMERHSEGAERGASLVEYVLMLSLILLVALAGVSAFGEGVGGSIDDSASRVVAAGGP